MARKTRQWDRMSRETYLREELRQAHNDIDGARDKQSWQALASLRRQAGQLRDQLDAVLSEKAKTSDLEEMSDDELFAAILADIDALPDSLAERLHAALEERVA